VDRASEVPRVRGPGRPVRGGGIRGPQVRVLRAAAAPRTRPRRRPAL